VKNAPTPLKLPDTKKPSGTACADDGNVCTTDACNGASVTCQHPPGNAGTQCRAAAGECDLAETCTGTSATCPANGFKPSSTVCRASRGGCDPAERCTGSSAACPADTGCTDTDPPIFGPVTDPVIAYATCKDGAVVTYTTPTATDAVDGVRPVTCTPASGSMFALGKKDVICTASDTKGNTATVKFTVWVKVQAPTDGTFFLQPINPDNSSIFKLGSTIPVKFKLQGASAGISNLAAKLYVAKVSSSVTGTFTEATATGGGDNGNTFRYDSVAKQYIFNLATSSLTPGTWTLKADLTCQYVTRLLRHLRAIGMRQCTPVNHDSTVAPEPLLGLSSGYVLRSADRFPKQGSKHPWQREQNHARNRLAMRRAPVEDPALEFAGR